MHHSSRVKSRKESDALVISFASEVASQVVFGKAVPFIFEFVIRSKMCITAASQDRYSTKHCLLISNVGLRNVGNRRWGCSKSEEIERLSGTRRTKFFSGDSRFALGNLPFLWVVIVEQQCLAHSSHSI